MADSVVNITAGAGTPIDARTEATNGHYRQVVVLGDPDTNAGVAPVSATTGLAVDVKAQPRASTATLSNVADQATSTTLLAANANRLGVVLVNDSTVNLFVKYGVTASATSYTYRLGPGETLRESLYTGRIDGIWASDAAGSARITELTS